MKWTMPILLGAFSVLQAPAQVSASIASWDHTEATFSAHNDGISPPNKLTGFVVASQDIVSRVVWDSSRGVFTGYDITVSPNLRARTAQVWIEPLTLTPEAIAQQLGPRWNPHWKQLKLPSYYTLSSLKLESPFLISLWIDGTSKAVDHVVIRERH